MFFLSWKTAQKGRLELSLVASDGKPVPLTSPDVTRVSADTYQIISVENGFLSKTGKVSAIPWKLEISTNGVVAGQQEQFQYSVLVDSTLRLDAGTEKAIYQTGDKIMVIAKLTEAGKPITGLTDIFVEATAPFDLHSKLTHLPARDP